MARDLNAAPDGAARSPRVLLLGPFPPPWGGVQTNIVALRDFLRRRGISCEAINLTRHRREDADGVYYPRSAVGVMRLLLRLRYEVIHLHIGGDLSNRLLMLGLVCCALPWARVVLTFHSGGYPASPPGRSARPFSWRGFALRRFARHIAVNSELADLFRRFGCPEERIRLIPPHAFSTTMLERARASEPPAPVRAFARAHTPLVVTLSGLEQEYDIPLQVEAMTALRRTHPDAGLVVIGSGSAEQSIRATIASSPVRDHVLLTGDLPHEIALRALTLADVFLRTTWYDGDAISVREALWLGTPVIATDNRLRPPGVHLVPVGDADAVTAAIRQSLVSPPERPAPVVDAGQENLENTLRLYQDMLQ